MTESIESTEPQDDKHAPPAASHHVLPVLPHSGKVDQLRREVQAHPGAASTPASPSVAGESPGAPGALPAAGPAAPPSIRKKLLEAKVIEALRQIYDPEIPVNIHELGLIYDIDVRDDASVKVRMTLTAPACPVAGSLPGEVERKIENIPEVKSAEVELVWDPPWSRDRMSEAALLQLGLF